LHTRTDGPGLWRAWSRWRILGLAIALVAGNFAWQLVAAALGGGLFLPVLAGGVLGVMAPLLLLGRDHGWRAAADFGLDRPRADTLALAALLAAASLAPTSLLAELSAWLHPVDPVWANALQEHMPRGPSEVAIAILAVVVTAPLVEEIVFRGLLHRLAGSVWGALPAVAVSSVIFGLVHGQPWYLFGLIGIGVVLAVIWEATRSVTACAVAHAVHNGVSLGMMVATGQAVSEAGGLTATDYALAGGSLAAAVLLARLLWRSGHGRRDG
jgi:membrane protease YdiL (CAAX protease family)